MSVGKINRPELAEFAAYLRKLRAARGWSLAAAARIADVSDTAILDSERARSRPCRRAVKRLAEAYDVREEDLLELGGYATKHKKGRILVSTADAHAVGAQIRLARLEMLGSPPSYKVARIARVATLTWNLLEAGLRVPHAETLDRIVLAVGLNPQVLRRMAGYPARAARPVPEPNVPERPHVPAIRPPGRRGSWDPPYPLAEAQWVIAR